MNEVTTKNTINEKIYLIRGVHVMLDRDLAELYQVETRALKQAVKRNQKRFPGDFMFILSESEIDNLVSQSVIPSRKTLGGAKPYAFTEQGVAGLSGVLTSDKAIDLHVHIMRAFIEIRRFVKDNALLFHRVDRLEKQQVMTETKLEQVLQAIENKNSKPQSGIFFEGQVFDAYVFVSDLIRHAKKFIVLIDNYIDETVLTQLSKANPKVKIYLLTKNASHSFKLDIKKYNEQYANITLIEFGLSHDRFVILDQKEIYHIGASLKDLGKKWFAFSKLEINSFGLMEKINNVITEKNVEL